jgi:hypothetical protein
MVDTTTGNVCNIRSAFPRVPRAQSVERTTGKDPLYATLVVIAAVTKNVRVATIELTWGQNG